MVVATLSFASSLAYKRARCLADSFDSLISPSPGMTTLAAIRRYSRIVVADRRPSHCLSHASISCPRVSDPLGAVPPAALVRIFASSLSASRIRAPGLPWALSPVFVSWIGDPFGFTAGVDLHTPNARSDLSHTRRFLD